MVEPSGGAGDGGSEGDCSTGYSDRGSHYRDTPKAGGKVDKNKPTQFGRAMAELGIEMIAAYRRRRGAVASGCSVRCRGGCPRNWRRPRSRRWKRPTHSSRRSGRASTPRSRWRRRTIHVPRKPDIPFAPDSRRVRPCAIQRFNIPFRVTLRSELEISRWRVIKRHVGA